MRASNFMTKKLQHLIDSQIEDYIEEIYRAWQPLKKSRLLITGGSGFFGRWILSTINVLNEKAELGMHCKVLTRDPLGLNNRLPFIKKSEKIDLLWGDITSFKLDEGDWDYVIHGATTSAHETFSGISELSKFKMLVQGTQNLMEQLTSVNRALFLSSGAVYLGGDTPIREDNLISPDTIAAHTGLAHGKRAAEYLFNEYCKEKKIDCKIARCFSFIGAGLPSDIHYAISSFVEKSMNNDLITIKSDGKVVRSYMDMRDLIVWLGLFLHNETPNKIYNVGSSDPISITDLAELIRKVTGSSSQIEIKNTNDINTGVHQRRYYVPDTERFKLDYKPGTTINLVKSIEDFAQSIK